MVGYRTGWAVDDAAPFVCGAVWAFATTKMGDVYVRKMALINCTLRTVVLCAVTNPSVGPDPNFAKISLRCSGARPLHAAYKENAP